MQQTGNEGRAGRPPRDQARTGDSLGEQSVLISLRQKCWCAPRHANPEPEVLHASDRVPCSNPERVSSELSMLLACTAFFSPALSTSPAPTGTLWDTWTLREAGATAFFSEPRMAPLLVLKLQLNHKRCGYGSCLYRLIRCSGERQGGGFVHINVYCRWIALGLGSGSGFVQVLMKHFPRAAGQ